MYEHDLLQKRGANLRMEAEGEGQLKGGL